VAVKKGGTILIHFMKKGQMSLESLNGSKFEKFKENEITNTMKILGGELVPTSNLNGTGKDCWNNASGKVDKDMNLAGTC
jgi:hypothetical protein